MSCVILAVIFFLMLGVFSIVFNDKYRRVIPLLFIALFFTVSINAMTIDNFESEITVLKDSEMLVTEKITATENNKISHYALYRNIPTLYDIPLSHTHSVGFQLIDAKIDGVNAGFYFRENNGGVRVYFGHKDTLLDQGTHTYTLTYKIDRELQYHDSSDELYWNITGNMWLHPIKKVNVVITLPKGVVKNLIKMKIYTGYMGDHGSLYKSNIVNNKIYIKTTETLAAGEGMAINLAWPKGYITSPSFFQSLKYTVVDNIYFTYMLLGLLLISVYYLIVWFFVGKDSRDSGVIPSCKPPLGFSPESIRYIKNMVYDERVFISAMLSMAAKGFLRIRKDLNDAFVLEVDSSNVDSLSRSEHVIVSVLFKGVRRVEVSDHNRPLFAEAVLKFHAELKLEFEETYFVSNKRYFFIGAILSSLFFIPIFLAGGIGLLVPIAIMIFSIPFLMKSFSTSTTKPLYGFLFSGLAFSFMVAVITSIVFNISFMAVSSFASAIVFFCINYLFMCLLKKPTVKGQMLISQVNSFKMFLEASITEHDGYRFAPELTPSLFERYLPYAYALDVEQKWLDYFLNRQPESHLKNYQPGWYYGVSAASFSIKNLDSSFLSPFSDAISMVTLF